MPSCYARRSTPAYAAATAARCVRKPLNTCEVVQTWDELSLQYVIQVLLDPCIMVCSMVMRSLLGLHFH